MYEGYLPQGSILGPALFNLYINDVCNVSMLMKSIVFADDTNFFYSGDNLSQVCETVSTELVIIILVLPPGVVSVKLCSPNAWHTRWRCR